ncbi:hypothetical protein JOM56_013092 [Amanita muscaria]
MTSFIVVVISLLNILRNAEVRTHEDLDRLHKAQAIMMYTFAEFTSSSTCPLDGVSTHGWTGAKTPRRALEEKREAKREGRRGATSAAAKRERYMTR